MEAGHEGSGRHKDTAALLHCPECGAQCPPHFKVCMECGEALWLLLPPPHASHPVSSTSALRGPPNGGRATQNAGEERQGMDTRPCSLAGKSSLKKREAGCARACVFGWVRVCGPISVPLPPPSNHLLCLSPYLSFGDMLRSHVSF